MSGVLSHPNQRLNPAQICGWAVGFLFFAAAVGVLAGIFWWQIVDLPGYTVGDDGIATISERGLTNIIGSDAWFVIIGLLAGIGLGVIAWRWFSLLGWPTLLIGVVAAFEAALLCWLTGYLLGPGPFDPRLAAAAAGDFVPLQLTLRAKVSLLVWVFGVSIPILLRSSLGRDIDDAAPAVVAER